MTLGTVFLIFILYTWGVFISKQEVRFTWSRREIGFLKRQYSFWRERRKRYLKKNKVVLVLQLDFKNKESHFKHPYGLCARLLCAQKTTPQPHNLARGTKLCPQESSFSAAVFHSLIKVRCIAENKQPFIKDVLAGDNLSNSPFNSQDLRSHLCCYSFLELSLSDSGSRGNYQGPVLPLMISGWVPKFCQQLSERSLGKRCRVFL